MNLAEFPDSHVQQLDANAVIEAIYNSIDNDCYNITGHQADSTIRQNPEINYAKTRHTTHGWEICIAWKDGSTSWHSFSDINNSFPIHLAKHAIANKLKELPVFRWWVKHSIKKEQRLTKANHINIFAAFP